MCVFNFIMLPNSFPFNLNQVLKINSLHGSMEAVASCVLDVTTYKRLFLVKPQLHFLGGAPESPRDRETISN